MSLRKRAKLILLPIHDPSDSDIPDLGAIEFINGTQRVQINTNDVRARSTYREAWQKYAQNLLQISKRLKAPLLWIETAGDPVKTLFAHAGSLATWKD